MRLLPSMSASLRSTRRAPTTGHGLPTPIPRTSSKVIYSILCRRSSKSAYLSLAPAERVRILSSWSLREAASWIARTTASCLLTPSALANKARACSSSGFSRKVIAISQRYQPGKASVERRRRREDVRPGRLEQSATNLIGSCREGDDAIWGTPRPTHPETTVFFVPTIC